MAEKKNKAEETKVTEEEIKEPVSEESVDKAEDVPLTSGCCDICTQGLHLL